MAFFCSNSTKLLVHLSDMFYFVIDNMLDYYRYTKPKILFTSEEKKDKNICHSR